MNEMIYNDEHDVTYEDLCQENTKRSIAVANKLLSYIGDEELDSYELHLDWLTFKGLQMGNHLQDIHKSNTRNKYAYQGVSVFIEPNCICPHVAKNVYYCHWGIANDT